MFAMNLCTFTYGLVNLCLKAFQCLSEKSCKQSQDVNIDDDFDGKWRYEVVLFDIYNWSKTFLSSFPQDIVKTRPVKAQHCEKDDFAGKAHEQINLENGIVILIFIEFSGATPFRSKKRGGDQRSFGSFSKNSSILFHAIVPYLELINEKKLMIFLDIQPTSSWQPGGEIIIGRAGG